MESRNVWEMSVLYCKLHLENKRGLETALPAQKAGAVWVS